MIEMGIVNLRNSVILMAVICGAWGSIAGADEFVPDENTVGLWHLNESSGTDVADSSGNANHGTLVGATAPTWTTGVYGNGLDIPSGYNTYQGEYGGIQLPSGILNMNNMTLEMHLNWDYLSSGPNPGETGFLGYLVSDGGTMFVRGYIDTSNPARYTCRLVYGIRLGDGGWLQITTPYEYSLRADEWMHVAFAREWDGSRTTARIYVDGELAVEDSVQKGSWFGGWQTYIGDISSVCWGGQIDEIRLSDVPRQFCGDWGYPKGDVNSDCYVDMDDLSLMTMKWLDSTEGFQDTTGTAALYHLDQMSGTVVNDDNSSGRAAHDGTLSGTTLPTWTTGYLGNGLHIGRHSGGVVQMGNLVHTSASFTLEFLFKWDYAYVSEPGYIFGAGGTCWARTNLISRDPQPALARITFGVRKGDGGWLEINTDDIGFDASRFMHVAFVREWDGAQTTARIYLDGELAASGVHNGGFWDDGSDLSLGHTSVGIGGTYDEVRFTKAALTATGIPECGEQAYDAVDINEDCHIDLGDFGGLSHSWMQCSDPADPDQCVDCNSRAFSEFTVDNDTLALWHMNEGSGSTLSDASGNGYTVAINGPYAWSGGRFDDGLAAPAFAENEYCVSTTPLPFTAADPDVYEMSMSAWVRLGGTSGDGAYALNVDTMSFIRVDSGGTSVAVGFYSWDSLGTWYQASVEPIPGQPAWADGMWHHVAGVYDGMPDGDGNGHVSMYWDGELVDSTAFPVPTEGVSLVNTGSGYVYIGTGSGDPGDPNSRFVGSIDEVRISDAARTDFFPGACE